MKTCYETNSKCNKSLQIAPRDVTRSKVIICYSMPVGTVKRSIDFVNSVRSLYCLFFLFIHVFFAFFTTERSECHIIHFIYSKNGSSHTKNAWSHTGHILKFGYLFS